MIGGGLDTALIKAITSEAWETLDQQFYTRLAQTIEPLDSTLVFFGDLFSSGKLRAYNDKGEEVEDDPLVALLSNPNELQDFKDFTKAFLYYYYAHGYAYVVPSSTSVGFEGKLRPTSKLYVPDLDEVKFTDETLFGTRKPDRVKISYEPLGLNNIYFKDVIPFYDVRQNTKKPWKGVSRLLALKQNITNYHVATMAKEHMMRRTGTQIVGLDGKVEDMGLDSQVASGRFDKDGTPEMTTHKAKFEEQLNASGLGDGKKSVVFTMLPIKVQALSAGLENIDFDKYAMQEARMMLNKLNVPKEFQNIVLSDVAKYDEKNSSLKFIFQNLLQPIADSLTEKLRKNYNHPNKVVIDYSNLPVFLDNEETKVDKATKVYGLLKSMYDSQLITLDEFKSKLEQHGRL